MCRICLNCVTSHGYKKRLDRNIIIIIIESLYNVRVHLIFIASVHTFNFSPHTSLNLNTEWGLFVTRVFQNLIMHVPTHTASPSRHEFWNPNKNWETVLSQSILHFFILDKHFIKHMNSESQDNISFCLYSVSVAQKSSLCTTPTFCLSVDWTTYYSSQNLYKRRFVGVSLWAGDIIFPKDSTQNALNPR